MHKSPPSCLPSTPLREGAPALTPLPQTPLTRRTCLLTALATVTGSARATPTDIPIALSSAVNAPFVGALLDELAAAMGIRWQIIRAPFTRVVRMAESGSALGFGMSPTPERARTLDFTQPLFESGVWTLSRAASPHEAGSIAELKGLSVCITRDAQFGASFDLAVAKEFRALPAGGDFASRLRMLTAGRCDVLLATHYNRDRSQLQSRIRAAGADPDQVVIGRQPLVTQSVHVAVRRDAELARWVPRLDQALAERRAAIAELLRDGP